MKNRPAAKTRPGRKLGSQEPGMEHLEKSRTYENLRKAFAAEASLHFRYLYYATLAEFEGLEKHAGLFRRFAEGGTTHVQGCYDFLKLVRDLDSGIPVGGTLKNLESLVQGETRQYSQTYPAMAKTAREEGFPDIAGWFDTLEKLKRSHVRKLRKLT